MTDQIGLVRDFLAQRRIAVAGVSRDPQQAANAVFRRLRDTGHEVVPINPNTGEVEGVTCFPDIASAPGPFDAVMIVSPPGVALSLVEECGRLGIRRVWMHRSLGPGSVSPAAVARARALGLAVIDRGCPLMHCGSVDVFHRCLRWMIGMG